MAKLEEVLVPTYLFHRYQLEAVSKLVAGLNYTYALRGDGQLVTAPVSKQVQLNALNAMIDCIDPKLLVLPDNIVKLIPPRPAGYNSSRELFKKRTGLSFDALAPAETAADFPMSFLFSTERLNRLALAEVDANGFGLNEMLSTLINRIWKADRRKGMEKLIQLQNEQILLTYLLARTVDDNASFITKAILQSRNYIRQYLP